MFRLEGQSGIIMSNRQVRDRRFRFGDNWLDFARSLSASQLTEAERSLRCSLERDTLAGLSFLDIGSGSGLFSLAARKLGARVHSFDFDDDSVLCTARLRDRYFAGDGEWTIALRCAELRGPTARLFAGAGIVAGSDPELELDETERKFRAFLDSLRWG